MAHSGIGTYFALDASVGGVLTDISTYLDGVTPSSDPDELDGTTFQPGVAAPARNVIAGFRTRNISLSGKWIAAAETFFSAVEGLNGLNYNYGPVGSTAGLPKIMGLCNCLSYTGPVSTVDGITTFTCELRASTRTSTTF